MSYHIFDGFINPRITDGLIHLTDAADDPIFIFDGSNIGFFDSATPGFNSGTGIIHIAATSNPPLSSPTSGIYLYAGTDGYLHVYQSSGTSFSVQPGLSNLTETGDVTGTVVGTTLAATVVALQGHAVESQTLGAAQDGYALIWHNASSQWQALALNTGAFSASGDLSGTSSSQTVIRINGSTVPAGGSLTTGNGLYVTGSAALSYSALNLAGGSGYVTGVLPTGNQAAQSLTLIGDVTGSGTTTSTSTTVAKIQGNTVTSGALTEGQFFIATSTSNWAATSLSGDVSESNTTPGKITVTGLQGNTVSSGTLTKGQFFVATSTSNWAATTLSGDVTESATTAGFLTVTSINTATVPVAGSLTTGNVLQVSGSSVLSYGAVNLAGGSNYVTGTLPTGNQAAQTMGGDVSGTTATATVIKINGTTVPAGGSLTTGNGLYVTGVSALSYSALNLGGGSGYVTGTLPSGNQAAQTMGGDVSGTTASATVIAIQSHAIESQSLGSTQDGYILTWHNASSQWQALPYALTGDFVAAGDLSGSAINQTVIALQGNSVKSQSLGASQDGYVLTWVNSNNDWEAKVSAGGTSFTAGGDLSGTNTSQNVINIHGASVPIAGSLTTGNVLQVSGSSALTYAAVNLAGGSAYVTGTLPSGNQAAQTMGGDVSGTTASATVAKIQGNTVTSGALTKGQFFVASSTSNWAATTLSGDITESATTAGFLTVTGIQGNTFTVGAPTKGQFVVATSTSNYGPVTLSGDIAESATTAGQLTVTSINTATVPAAGSLTTGNVLQVSGSSALTYGAVNLAGGSAYVTGTLPTGNQASQSLTLTGDVTSSGGTTASASTTVAKIQGNTVTSGALTKGQFFIATTTSNWAATSLSGDVSESSSTAGDLTVIALQGNAVKSGTNGSSQDGYVLTWVNTDGYWEAKPSSGSGFTAGGDLSGTSTSQTVIAIHGATVPIAGSLTTGNVLQVSGSSALSYGAVNLAGGSNYVTGILPTGNQASQALSGDVTGTTASNTVISITGGSGVVNVSSSGNIITWNSATTAPGITQTAASSTSSGSGSAGADLSIISQAGQAATGATHNGGNGANLVLSSGAGGTSGSATPGNAGNVILETGGTTRLTINQTGVVTIANLGTGVVHADSSGNLTSSTVVNVDISAAAAIAVSKLAAGSSAQVLLNNSTPTPTWTTLSGDMTVGNTGTTIVAKINGASVPTAGTLVTGNVLQVSGGSSLSYSALNLAGGSNYVTGILPTGNQAAQTMGGDVVGTTASSTVIAIRGNDIKSQSLGSTQDGYVLTWVNADGYWEAKPSTGSGSSVTWADDLAGSTGTNQYVAAISGNAGVGGIIPINATSLAFKSTELNPSITQTQPVPANPGTHSTIELLIAAQNGGNALSGDNNGGYAADLVLAAGIGGIASGAGTNGNDGYIFLQTGGNTKLQITDSDIIIPAFSSAGVVHNDSGGNLSSSLIVNADVSVSAAIEVSKLAPGTNAQILINNSTPIPVWVSITGDVVITDTGVTTVVAIQDNPIASGMLGSVQDGYVLTWDNADGYWKAEPSQGGGGGIGAYGEIYATAQSLNTSYLSYIQIDSGHSTTWTSGNSNNTTLGDGTITVNETGEVLIDVSISTYEGSYSSGFNYYITKNGTAIPGSTMAAYSSYNYLLGGTCQTNASINMLCYANSGDVFALWVEDLFSSQNLTVDINFRIASVAGSGGGGGSVTWANDLAGSTPTNQYVAAISGNAGTGGTIPINATSLSFGDTQSSPTITQAPTSSTTQSLTVQAQSTSSGTGGTLIIGSGSGTSGLIANAGEVQIQVNGTIVASAVGNQLVTTGRQRAVNPQTSNYNILVTDDVIAVGSLSGTITIYMPSTPNNGDAYDIKDTLGSAATYNITIDGNGNNIDGVSTYVMTINYQSATLVWTGANWSLL
jgi:hypothetical protein